MYKILAKTLFVGRKLHYLPSCHSTNDIASELLAQKKATEGTLIITDDQIAGRGQRGNAWESVPYQNVTLSVVLLPNFLHPKDQFLMTMMISVALIDLLCAFLPDGLRIKWPNDIYYYDRKIAGILIESAIQQEDIESTII
ncbi:MAG: biotin--[acetyl-CoA-carboxylase] ligase, partial [Bacteroidetes bacterium]|nr:biotin--[acetyl-CoA-carboxylase] ligase [Bacteroidota bacterium]